jgi:hypothetical protein
MYPFLFPFTYYNFSKQKKYEVFAIQTQIYKAS